MSYRPMNKEELEHIDTEIAKYKSVLESCEVAIAGLEQHRKEGIWIDDTDFGKLYPAHPVKVDKPSPDIQPLAQTGRSRIGKKASKRSARSD
jgi:hypothetical protein